MQVLILGNQSDTPTVDEDTYYAQTAAFFAATVRDADVVEYAVLDDLLFLVTEHVSTITVTRTGKDLAAYDVVFMRGQFRQRLDMVYATSAYIRHAGRRVVNDYSRLYTSSKLAQAIAFSMAGMPTPYTLCGSAYVLMKHHQQIAMPLICKEVYGAHGKHNFLVTTEAQLMSILEADTEGLYVLQEFIPNDGDYRLLIIGENHMIIKRSAAAGSHLNNTSQGGSAELLESDALPPALIRQAHDYIRSLGMEIAGVDLIHDARRNRYVFLEVNSQPQIMTGAFIDQKQALLAQYFNGFQAESA